MTNVELEKARVRLYQKADRKPFIMAFGGSLFALFGFIAFLNLIGSVSLGLRADQRPIQRFLFWLVFAIMGFIRPYGFFFAQQQRGIQTIVLRLPTLPRHVPATGAFGMDHAQGLF